MNRQNYPHHRTQTPSHPISILTNPNHHHNQNNHHHSTGLSSGQAQLPNLSHSTLPNLSTTAPSTLNQLRAPPGSFPGPGSGPGSGYPYGLSSSASGSAGRTSTSGSSNVLNPGGGGAYVPGLGRTGTGTGGLGQGGGFLQQSQRTTGGGGGFGFGVLGSSAEPSLDPNEFPALGSTSSNQTSNNNPSSAGGTSYASQAGQGGSATLGAGSISGSTGNSGTSQNRDFTDSDFPALGGGNATSPQQGGQSNTTSSPGAGGGTTSPPPQSGPPGLNPALNGFQSHNTSQTEQHRQNLLGTLTSGLSHPIPQQTPGMLNLAHAHGRVNPYSSDDKRGKIGGASVAAWNAASSNNTTNGLFNGLDSHQHVQHTHPHGTASLPHHSTANPSSTNNPSTAAAVAAQAGVTATTTARDILSHPNPNAAQNPALQTPSGTNSLPNSSTQLPNAGGHPTTPAQQVLMSAADRWGLIGLIAMIKNAGASGEHSYPNRMQGPTGHDGGPSSVGTDLGTMGLDMGYPGNLYSTFITPWADQSAAHSVEPDFHLPSCYNVVAPAPGPGKAAAFSDETLFFMFYSSPRDALQEVAAQELYNRNWRYHKTHLLWITKESGTAPSTKIPGGESGVYTYWDPENWSKERKEMDVIYSDLEEKTMGGGVFGNGDKLVMPSQQQPGQGQVQQGQQGQGQGQQQPVQPPTPGLGPGQTQRGFHHVGM